jgi:transposase
MGDFVQIRQTDKRTGIVYVYDAEKYWDAERQQTRYRGRKLIGHVDRETGEVVANRATRANPKAPASRRLFCGSAHLLDGVSEQIGLGEDLSAALGPIAPAVASIARYLLVEGSSTMARFNRWSRTHAHPLGREMASQRISEMFESVRHAMTEAYFRARAGRASGQYWFYDTTSISSYSQCIESVRWGRNKDLVPLPQLNVAAVLDAQSGLPVWYKDVSGNISDVSIVKALLREAEGIGAGRMRLCMDRGFYSKANVDALMGEHMKFLIGLKASYPYVSAAIKAGSGELRSWRNYDEKHHVFGLALPYTWKHERTTRSGDVEKSEKRSYLYLYYEPERVARDEERFAQLLRRLSHELESGCRSDGHEASYERYFKRARGGAYVGRDDVIEAERSRFGYFALLSNDASLTAETALSVYRDKDMIEKAFGDIKDRLDFRTPKVENAETLRGKMLCVFIALTLALEIRRRMSAAELDAKYTLHELFDELDSIERYESEGHRPKVLAVTEKQKKIYEAMGVKPLVAS